jgi:hypothetical protein
MRTRLALLLVAGIALPALSCGSSDETSGTTTGTGTSTTSNGGHAGTTPNGGGGSGATGGTNQGGAGGAISVPDRWFGDACACTDATDNLCAQQTVPKPAAGTIVGCENVPINVTGAALVCLRTYTGPLANKTYFANGYCGLQATACVGDAAICDYAVWGSYASLVACPAGTVLLTDTANVTALGIWSATVETKVCARGCTGASQCREAETDPADGNAATQYACMNKDGVQFCYDPRDLGDNYTAVAF